MKRIILLILGSSVTISPSALEISNPTTISPQEDVWYPQTTINNNGAAIVVWIKSQDQGRYSLQTSMRANGESPWTHSEAICEPMKISTYYSPSLAADGTSTIIWTGANTGQYYYTQKKSSKPWLPAKEIQYPGLSKIKAVIADLNGDPLVLASSGESTIYSYHCRSNDQSPKPYTDLLTLPTPDKKQAISPLLLKNSEKIAALWCVFEDKSRFLENIGLANPGYKDYHFKSSLYTETETWNTEIDDLGRLYLKSLDKKATDISTSLNNKNQVGIIWTHFESSKHKLKTIISHGYTVIRESEDGFTDSAIWIDDDGNAAAVWIEPFKKKKAVYAKFKSQSNNEWQVEQIISNIESAAEHAQLSFSNGVFVVVWGEESDSMPFKNSIWGATLAPAEKCKWSDPVLLSPKGENCWHPSIAFGEKGGIITWTSHVRWSSDFQIQVANLIAP